MAAARLHQSMLESMVNSHASLVDSRARFSQNASNRAQAASAVTVKPAGSAVGMSSAYAQKSFYGTQGERSGHVGRELGKRPLAAVDPTARTGTSWSAPSRCPVARRQLIAW